MTDMDAATKRFFASPYFAVAGASQSPHKFGYKVLSWYYDHSLPVVPITPSRPNIILSNKTALPSVPSPSALPHPTETSLSIITQPSITRQILKEAKEVGIPAVWLQPGSFDTEGLEYAQREFEAGVGGEEGSTRGGEGWCVLVDGGWCMQAAREDKGTGKL